MNHLKDYRIDNNFPLQTRCIRDSNVAFCLAYHNVGAGGVDHFGGTVELRVSEKRAAQRAARAARTLGRPF